jgi:hypothetical protein
MSRKKKLFFNTLTGIIKQVVTVLCGFILPRYMLVFYGSSVNGLISSITHFLSFISLLDMGVGAVIQANLYKPLADKDNTQISMILKASERFFRRLAYIFIGYIIVLCIAFPTVLNTTFSPIFTVSLLIILSASTLAQYLFGMTYQLLLNADQRPYVQLIIQIGTILLNTVFSVVLMSLGASIHIVKLTAAAVYVLRPLGQILYVRKHYDIDHKVKFVGDPIKQKWNGFSQHMAAVVCQNIDVAVLTVFSTLENVSIYSVYYNITYGVQQIIITAATGLEALFGNMIAKDEKEQLLRTFSEVERITHIGVTLIFSITAFTIVPFVSVYTRGINDTNYIVPVFGLILTAAYAVQCLRVPYFCVIKAAGHFKETQNGAYISALLNVAVTVALVFRFGLIGAASGTLVAMIYHTCYFVWYLRKNILKRHIGYFVKYLVTDCLIAGVSYYAAKWIVFEGTSYIAWIIFAIEIALIVLGVNCLISIVFYRKQIKSVIGLLKGQR